MTGSAFAAQAERHRRELHVHCYRMLAYFDDAEDAVQETYLRAWRGRESFEGGPMLRAWLYRIATNVCLAMLADRRGRTMPYLIAPGDDGEPAWLEPFPDAQLEDDPETRPDAVYSRREATRLAFVTALQRLPARQRAILILRDVVAMSADEAAEALDITVATANSLLQRARETLDGPPRPRHTDPRALAELLARVIVTRLPNRRIA